MDLIDKMLVFSPEKRLTAAQCLESDYLSIWKDEPFVEPNCDTLKLSDIERPPRMSKKYFRELLEAEVEYYKRKRREEEERNQKRQLFTRQAMEAPPLPSAPSLATKTSRLFASA